MSFYFIILFFVVYVICFFSLLNAKREVFLVISLLFLFVISTFRNEIIGTDYKNYIVAFETISKTGTYYMEKGYVLLNVLVSHVTQKYYGIAFAVNLIFFTSFFYYIRNNVDSKYWDICLLVFLLNPYFFIQSTFNLMRQTCATGIVMIGLTSLLKKPCVKSVITYLLFILISAQFHRVSYFLVIIPVIFYFPWNKVYWLLMLLLSIIINYIGVNSFLSLFFVETNFNAGYANYEETYLNHPIFILLVSIFFIIILLRYEDCGFYRKKEKNILNLYLFSLCLLIIAVTNKMVYRVYVMFAFFSIPGVAVLFVNDESKKFGYYFRKDSIVLRSILIAYYICFYLGYVILLSINGDVNYIPFKFV